MDQKYKHQLDKILHPYTSCPVVMRPTLLAQISLNLSVPQKFLSMLLKLNPVNEFVIRSHTGYYELFLPMKYMIVYVDEPSIK